MRSLVTAAFAALALMTSAAVAAEGQPEITDFKYSFEYPWGTYDQNQLQRGLKVYTEVCSSCHGLKYLAFRDLATPGGPEFSDEQAKAYAEQFELFDQSLNDGEGDYRTATFPDKFPAVTALGAPDLTLMAKARAGFHGPLNTGINQIVKGMGGPEYIASLFTHYTGKEETVAGATLYENTAFAGGWISMAPPLYDEAVTFDDGAPNDVSHMAQDVSAFLMWTAEPKLAARKQMGLTAVIMLIVLSGLLYFTNKRIWADVKVRRNDPAE